jgi:hypothetical protein
MFSLLYLGLLELFNSLVTRPCTCENLLNYYFLHFSISFPKMFQDKKRFHPTAGGITLPRVPQFGHHLLDEEDQLRPIDRIWNSSLSSLQRELARL